MSPRPKTQQPPHLRGDDVCRGLQDGYDEALLESLRDNRKILAFEYKHGNGRSDRDALYKYKDVIVALAKINPVGVWNFTTIQQGIVLWDKKMGKILGRHPSLGVNAIRTAAANLLQLLQDAYRMKKNSTTGARTPAWVMDILKHMALDQGGKALDLDDQDSSSLPIVPVPSASSSSGINRGFSDAEDGGTNRGFSGAGEAGTNRGFSGAGEAGTNRGFSGVGSGGDRGKKRSLRFSLSSASDTPTEWYPEDKNETEVVPKYVYDWDETKNTGKRMMPGTTKWQHCDELVVDESTGFMKCIWHEKNGNASTWLSEMPITDYEQVDTRRVRVKPAASKTSPIKKKGTERKNAYSRIYHQTYKYNKDNGVEEGLAKKRAADAANKHVASMGM